MTETYCDTANSRLYYEDTPGKGVPLVFLYGLGCSIAHWKYQIKHFQEQGRRVIWLDYRGHGKSNLKREKNTRVTLNHLREDVWAVCDQLGLKEAIMLGQSMGGTVGLLCADERPQFVRGLVLQGSPPRGPSRAMELGALGLASFKAMSVINRVSPKTVKVLFDGLKPAKSMVREIIRVMGFNPHLVKTEDVDEYVRHLMNMDPNLFYELADDLEAFDISKLEKMHHTPTLVIAGAKDRVVPVRECRWLVDQLSRAELKVIPHGSHCPHLEDPGLFSQLVEEFVISITQPKLV